MIKAAVLYVDSFEELSLIHLEIALIKDLPKNKQTNKKPSIFMKERKKASLHKVSFFCCSFFMFLLVYFVFYCFNSH